MIRWVYWVKVFLLNSVCVIRTENRNFPFFMLWKYFSTWIQYYHRISIALWVCFIRFTRKFIHHPTSDVLETSISRAQHNLVRLWLWLRLIFVQFISWLSSNTSTTYDRSSFPMKPFTSLYEYILSEVWQSTSIQSRIIHLDAENFLSD